MKEYLGLIPILLGIISCTWLLIYLIRKAIRDGKTDPIDYRELYINQLKNNLKK